MGMGVGRRCAPKCSDFAYEMLQFGAYFTPGPIDSVIAKTIDDYRLKVNECIN